MMILQEKKNLYFDDDKEAPRVYVYVPFEENNKVSAGARYKINMGFA